MKLVGYLKSKWRLYAMLATFAAIFAVIFLLYRLPVRTVLYASLICLAAGAVFAAFDYLSYLRRSRAIDDYTASECDTSLLPEPREAIDRDYDAALRDAAERRRTDLSRAGRESQEQRGYFTVWAHQIKIPIAAMRLILQGEDTRSSRELEAQLFMTEQYVQMVLAYLRTGGDSTDYVIRDCRLEPLIRASVRRFAPMFIRKHLTIDLPSTDTAVLTDEKWLTFVFEQVLSNAVKYTREGGVTVTVSTQPSDDVSGDTVVLSVRDTGIGIPADDLPRVFEYSYTGCNGREDMRATGIGLYLSRQILTRLGHSIEISSTESVGTEVRIYLPISSTEKEKVKYD